MLILISYNFTGFFTVDLYIVNWYVLKSDDCPYGHVISVYCYLCVCLCLQGIFPNLWYACTRYMEGNKLNWIQIECRVYVCQRNSRLLQRHIRDVILLPQTFTDITLWRVAVALAAILVPYFCSRSVGSCTLCGLIKENKVLDASNQKVSFWFRLSWNILA